MHRPRCESPVEEYASASIANDEPHLAATHARPLNMRRGITDNYTTSHTSKADRHARLTVWQRSCIAANLLFVNAGFPLHWVESTWPSALLGQCSADGLELGSEGERKEVLLLNDILNPHTTQVRKSTDATIAHF